MTSVRRFSRQGVTRASRVGAAALLVAAAGALISHGARAESAVAVPPAQAAIAEGKGLQKLVVAGGCFWGVQGVYQHMRGVTAAVSGYAGGPASAANYTAVSTGRTGHAEAVEITYDPAVVTTGELLQVFFGVAHDPTELNRQGPDTGPQYRSEIFTTTPAQAQIARAYVAQLDGTKTFPSKIVTKIETLPAFYPAEAYHQDYLLQHPYQPYIVFNDMPKVAALKQLFPQNFRADPVRVAAE